MKIQRTLQIALILCFCAMLALPLACADFVGGRVSNTENRMLARFPDPQDGTMQFYKGIEPWINDNIGFRDAASQLMTRLDYELFRRSAKSTNLIGKEDWIYYYTDAILQDFIGGNAYSQEVMQSFTTHMQELKELLAQRGCETLFVLVPDKKSVYPENYPAGIHRVVQPSRMNALADALYEQGVEVLNLQPVLEKAKPQGFVYSQRLDDAHWNNLGAFVGYRAICERLQPLGARPGTDWTITPYEATGLFNMAVPLTEVNYSINCNASSAVVDASSELDMISDLQYNGDAATYRRRYRNTDESLPKLLFIGDSYMQSSYSFYPVSFSEVTYLHYSDAPHFLRVVDEFAPDIVIFESAERMLDYWLDTLAGCAKEQ